MFTDKEVKMLQQIRHNHFDGTGDCMWTECLHEGPHGYFVDQASFGGIIASLAKKGLVWTNGETLGLTPEGKAAADEHPIQ